MNNTRIIIAGIFGLGVFFYGNVFVKLLHKYSPVVTPTESRLRNLLHMSIDTSNHDPDIPNGWRNIVARCLNMTKRAKAYCAGMVGKNPTSEKLRGDNYVFIHWRADHVCPDRWHVTQKVWDQNLGKRNDEWVTIGKQNYQKAALWFRTEDSRNDVINHRLLVDNLLYILNEAEPTSLGVHWYKGSMYLLLQYTSAAISNLNPKKLGFSHRVEELHEAQIWICLKSGFLVKGIYLFEIKPPTGELVHFELHHMFTSFNENVRVDPPPWLNIGPNSSGELVIINTQIPVLNHHP